MMLTDWRESFRDSFKSTRDLSLFLSTPLDQNVDEKYPLFVPRRITEKIKKLGLNSPYAKQFLSQSVELDLKTQEQGLIDPIGDELYLKAPQLIHRYENRALFTPTTICPVHCRYCFRKNELYSSKEIFHSEFEKTIDYLRSHPEIEEIIFTGGDPFTLSDEKLAFYLEAFSKIDHLKYLRFHTRYPVILPERFGENLLNLLEEFKTRFLQTTIVIHANLAEEFDEDSVIAIKKLDNIGLKLLSQSVLLKDVNNDLKTLTLLIEKLLSLGIRPYYLHHPDLVKGGMHFYLSEAEGRELYYKLRKKFPGWALPQYIKELPLGAGKSLVSNLE